MIKTWQLVLSGAKHASPNQTQVGNKSGKAEQHHESDHPWHEQETEHEGDRSAHHHGERGAQEERCDCSWCHGPFPHGFLHARRDDEGCNDGAQVGDETGVSVGGRHGEEEEGEKRGGRWAFW